MNRGSTTAACALLIAVLAFIYAEATKPRPDRGACLEWDERNVFLHSAALGGRDVAKTKFCTKWEKSP